MWWIIGIAALIFIWLFIYSLCRVAASADEHIEQMLRDALNEKDKQK